MASRNFYPSVFALLAQFALVPFFAEDALAQTKWVATWATSPEPLVSAQNAYNPPTPSGAPANSGLANNSVRQVLRVSIGGDTLRMRFTNEYTNVPVRINAATIAVSAGAGIIDTNTIQYFKFSSNDSITMPANAYVWSDAMAFNLAPGAQVQITLHLGPTPASGTYPGMTVHRGSRTVPRVLAGNRVADRTFAGASTLTMGSWVISSMEVRAPQTAGAVAILGNSITDGFGVTIDAFNRWTDALTTKLLASAGTSNVGVLNGGIGAGNMLSGGTSTPGLQRYKRDLFDHSGVKWAVIYLGVNDIGNANSNLPTVAQNLINAYGLIADSARARGIKAYGATITPFNGNAYHNTNREAARQTLNAWIRSTDRLDGVIDFDKIIRNPSDTTRILTTYNNDGLHPNIAGYAQMGNSIDTNLFIEEGTSIQVPPGSLAGYALGNTRSNGSAISFWVPRETFVSLKVHSVRGEEVAELGGRVYAPGEHSVQLRPAGLPGGVYLFSMRAGKFTATRKAIVSGR